MKLFEIFLNESPISELEAHLTDPHSYEAIDRLMVGICTKAGITPKELHDLFVEKHGMTPDDWVQQAIKEAPVADIEPLGDFTKPGGFRSKVDKTIAVNPKVHARAKQFFSRSPYNFRLYPINVPGGSKFVEKGIVSEEWLEENIPVASEKIKDMPVQDDEIVIFFTNNSGAERVPFTPWMMAHRIGHAFNASKSTDTGINAAFKHIEKEFRYFITTIIQNLYGKRSINVRSLFELINEPIVKALFAELGTMRSARSVKQYSRPYEFIYELFAQYINLGELRFNPLPERFRYGNKRGGPLSNIARAKPDEISDYNHWLEAFATELEYYFDSILTSAEGKIFVM